MKRVTGIGGVFFTARDAPTLRAWYAEHLGIDVQSWGGTSFRWTDDDGNPVAGTTAWTIAEAEAEADADAAPASSPPATSTFTVNYRVEDLRALVDLLRDEGCEVVGDIDESEYGLFAWVVDPEGNKVELWEPPAGQ